MDAKIKLTKNKSNQFNSLINNYNSLDLIYPKRRKIKFKQKKQKINLHLSEENNIIKTNKSK